MARYAFLVSSAAAGVAPLPPLRYTANDVERLGAALKQDAVGFQCTHAQTPAKPADVLVAFERLAMACRPGDSLLFYFSGHGFLRRGQLFLLLDGADLEHPVSTALPISSIKTIFANTRASVRLLVLDCCHSGAAAEQVFAKAGSSALGDPLGSTARDSASLILAACGRTAAARELPELEMGFLTHLLVRALTTHMREADRDGDRFVSVQDLVSWMGDEVDRFNTRRQDPVEKPELYGELRGDVFLTGQLLGENDEVERELLAQLDEALRELRSLFATNSRLSHEELKKAARPMKRVAATFTQLDFLDDLLAAGDDAAIFAAATVLEERRDPRYMQRLYTYIDAPWERLRGAAHWRVLRAIRETLPLYRPKPAVLDELREQLRRAARIRAKQDGLSFKTGTVLKMIDDLVRRLNLRPEDVFTKRQLEVRNAHSA